MNELGWFRSMILKRNLNQLLNGILENETYGESGWESIRNILKAIMLVKLI